MQMPLKIISIILFSITMFLYSCNKEKTDVDEGVIKYKITYLEDESTNPVISIMPKSLIMRFKDNSVIMEVEGWLGIFKSSFIKNRNDSQAVTLLKMLNKKYCYCGQGKDGYIGFDAYNNIKIIHDDSTKNILGFNCKHAKAVLSDKNIEFDIYYTDKIKIKNPNKFTPYQNIQGVLMDFQIEMNGLPMHLTATEFKPVNIDDKIFKVPEGYKNVERQEIDKIFSSIEK